MTAKKTFMVTLDKNFRIENWSKSFSEIMGAGRRVERGDLLRKYISQKDQKKVEKWLRQFDISEEPASLVFNLLASDRRYIAVDAHCLRCDIGGEYRFVVTARSRTPLASQLDIIKEENHFLRRVLEQSVEAVWCIEFEEPVDLLEGEDEIIRQVFENRCSWRLCNKAMERVYEIPEGTNLNDQPVARYFPRSRANERYIRGLIRERFWVDSALSVDIQHSGKAIYGDNSVRSDIVDNKLLRFWGTMHDVTRYRRLQAELDREQASLHSILSSIPEPILVIGEDLRLQGTNPAFETFLGQSIEFSLGRKIEDLFQFGEALDDIGKCGAEGVLKRDVQLRTKKADSAHYAAWVAPIWSKGCRSGFVVTLRPAQMELERHNYRGGKRKPNQNEPGKDRVNR